MFLAPAIHQDYRGLVIPINVNLLGCHFFPEHKHLVILSPVFLHIFRNGRPMMMLVPELNDKEAAAILVEVDVALLFSLPPYQFGALHRPPSAHPGQSGRPRHSPRQWRY